MAPARFAEKKNEILLALLKLFCSSRQRIVIQQCFFSFRSFAASPSVTSTLYFFSMSDLTVDTVKAMPCQAPRGELSQCGLKPKRNLVKVFHSIRLLVQLALGSEVCSGLENQQHDSADTAREPRSPMVPMPPPPAQVTHAQRISALSYRTRCSRLSWPPLRRALCRSSPKAKATRLLPPLRQPKLL